MKNFINEWVVPAVIAIVIVLFLNKFVFILVTVPTGSMETTIMPGDRLYVNKLFDIEDAKRGDIVSQAEREVFASRVNSVNPQAVIMSVNGLTGQGAFELSTLIYDKDSNVETVKGSKLRFPMPSALCSYCLGETRIGEEYQMGNVRKMNLGGENDKH